MNDKTLKPYDATAIFNKAEAVFYSKVVKVEDLKARLLQIRSVFSQNPNMCKDCSSMAWCAINELLAELKQ